MSNHFSPVPLDCPPFAAFRSRFALTGPCIGLLAGQLCLGAAGHAYAVDYHFDVNGSAPGSGITNGGNYAVSGSYWTTSAAGTGVPGAYLSRNNVNFSAGTDAFGLAFAVSGDLVEPQSTIQVQEGHLTLSAKWSAWGLSTIRALDGTRLDITSGNNDFYGKVLDFDVQGNSVITLNGISTTSGRTGGVAKNGAGLLIITGAASARGITVHLNSGDLRIAHGNALFTPGYGAAVTVVNGSLQLSNNITVANNPLTLNGQGVNARGALRNIAGTNTFASVITLGSDSRIQSDAGTRLVLNPTGADAVNGAFGLTLGGDGAIHIARPLAGLSRLIKEGSGTVSLSASNTFPGPTLINSGSLQLLNASLAGDITNHGALVVSNASAQTLPNRIAGSGQVVKQAAGRLTLASTHDFIGPLHIEGGSVALGVGGGIPSASLISVSNGSSFDVSAVSGFTLNAGQTLRGSGMVTGAVLALAGAQLSPGLPAAPGALSFANSLAETGGVTNHFDLSGATNGANDQVLLNGNLVLSGMNFVRISYVTLANGTYHLIRTTGGTVMGSVSSMQLLGFIPGTQVATLTTNAAGTEINLVLAPNTRPPARLIWRGDGGNNRWDENNSLTWRSNSTVTVYHQGDRVTFDDSGATNPLVNLSGELAPGAATVAASNDFTFAGDGGLTGPVSLVKSNSGRLVIHATNSFQGGALIAGGTVQLGNGCALGSGAVTNNAVLSFACAAPAVFSNTISGSGSLTHLLGTLCLSGSNKFSGECVAGGGTLQVGNPSALGTPEGATRIGADAALDLNGHDIGLEPITLAGGTLANGSPAAASVSGTVHVTDDSVVTGIGDIALTGGLSGSAGLTKLGSNSLTLYGAGDLAGATTVAGGTLWVGGATGAGAITVGAGSALGGDGLIRGAVTNQAGGTISLGAHFTRLTVSNALMLSAGSTTVLKVGRMASSATNDSIAGIATLTCGGRLVIRAAGYPVQEGDRFQLFSANSFGGSFDSVELPWLPGELVWDLSQLSNGLLRAVSLPGVSTYAQRRAWALSQAVDNPGTVDAFVLAAVYFTLGATNNGQATALSASRDLLSNHLANPDEQVQLFNLWPAMDCYLRFGGLLDSETRSNIQYVVTHFLGYAGTTTSNLKTLGHVVRYLGSEAFGEAAFLTNAIWRANDPNAFSSLQALIAANAKSGFGEHASRPYYNKNLLPMLSLAQLATNPVISHRAMLAFVGGLSQNAGCWMRGHLGVSTSRSYPDQETQRPMGSMRLLWLYFGGDVPPDKLSDPAFAAVMNCEPPPVIQTAAADRSLRHTSRGGYFGAQQVSFLDRDYVLFSEGPEYFGNFQVYASGAMWCDPDDNHFSFLWLCAPFNDDPAVNSASWPHGMNRAIYSEAQWRDSLLQIYNFDPTDTNRPPYVLCYVPGGWQAMINDASASGRIFLHYGTVMLAINAEVPFKWNTNSRIYAVSQSPTRPGDSEFRIWGAPIPDRMQAVPELADSYTGAWQSQFAMAIETARPDLYAGATPADQLAAFRADIVAKTGLGHLAGNPPTGYYTNRHGDTLQVQETTALTPSPILINGQALSLTNWPLTDNPWIYQSVGGNLSLHDGTNTIVYDFNAWTITTNSSVAPPTGLLASANSNCVHLTWSPRVGTMHYNVKRATGSGGPYTLVGTTTNSCFFDATIAGATTYYYIVTAANSFGESTNSNEAVLLTLPATPVPPAMSGPAMTNGQFSFLVAGPAGCAILVQVSTNLAQWDTVFTNPPGATPVRWTDPATNPAHCRFYRLRIAP